MRAIPLERRARRRTFVPMTTTHHPETPTLTPALFADLLDPSKSPFDLCHTHNLALDQLHAVTTGAHFRASVRMLEEIHAERAAAQRPQRERLALDALDRIANQIPATNTHAETVRRAAAALLRHKPQSAVSEVQDRSERDVSQPTNAEPSNDGRAGPSDPVTAETPNANGERADLDQSAIPNQPDTSVRGQAQPRPRNRPGLAAGESHTNQVNPAAA